MKKERILLILGIWVAVMPFLGFPHSWRKLIFLLVGMGMIYLAYMFRKQTKEFKAQISSEEPASMNAFVDNITTSK